MAPSVSILCLVTLFSRCSASVETDNGKIHTNPATQEEAPATQPPTGTRKWVGPGEDPPVRPWRGGSWGKWSSWFEYAKVQPIVEERAALTEGVVEDFRYCDETVKKDGTEPWIPLNKFQYTAKWMEVATVSAPKVTAHPRGHRQIKITGMCPALHSASAGLPFWICERNPPTGERALVIRIRDTYARMIALDYLSNRLDKDEGPIVNCKLESISLFRTQPASAKASEMGMRWDFKGCSSGGFASVLMGLAKATKEQIATVNSIGNDGDCTGPSRNCVLCKRTNTYLPIWKAKANCPGDYVLNVTEVEAKERRLKSDVTCPDTSRTCNDGSTRKPDPENDCIIPPCVIDHPGLKDWVKDVCSDQAPTGRSLNFITTILGKVGSAGTQGTCFGVTASMVQLTSNRSYGKQKGTSCFQDSMQFTLEDKDGGLALMPVPESEWDELMAMLPNPTQEEIKKSDATAPPVPAMASTDRVCVSMPSCDCEFSCDYKYESFKSESFRVNAAPHTQTLPERAAHECDSCWPLSLFIYLLTGLLMAFCTRMALTIRQWYSKCARDTSVEWSAYDSQVAPEETEIINLYREEESNIYDDTNGSQKKTEKKKDADPVKVFSRDTDGMVFLFLFPLFALVTCMIFSEGLKIVARIILNKYFPKGPIALECPCESLLPMQFAIVIIVSVVTFAITDVQTFVGDTTMTFNVGASMYHRELERTSMYKSKTLASKGGSSKR